MNPVIQELSVQIALLVQKVNEQIQQIQQLQQENENLKRSVEE